MNGINYHVNTPNFHIENLKHFEYLVEILWQNIVFWKYCLILSKEESFTSVPRKETKTLFYIMKSKNYESMTAFFSILKKQQKSVRLSWIKL